MWYADADTMLEVLDEPSRVADGPQHHQATATQAYDGWAGLVTPGRSPTLDSCAVVGCWHGT